MKINKLHVTIFSPCINVAVKNKSAEIGSQCLLNLDEQLAVYRIGSTCDVYSELAVNCLLILATIESIEHTHTSVAKTLSTCNATTTMCNFVYKSSVFAAVA